MAALKSRTEVRVAEGEQPTPATVALIVADKVDEVALGLLREARGLGVKQTVFLVPELDDASVMAAVEAGVTGLVRRREATPDRLVQVIASVHRGAGVIPPDLLGRLLRQVSRMQGQVPSPRGPGRSGLSDREEGVLKLVAAGHDTREIAQQLSYSERTVKNVLHDVINRYQLRNRSHAVAYAIREGLI
ncbi:LuxR C-terminal-related transcriptional regulator [Streptomyces sp. NPDC052040]|uniref:helix-turn-helix transcriptional regulator n=1 Tax=unclassified Streptomyces TaxID=2593676 RepID=UPI0037CD031F